MTAHEILQETVRLRGEDATDTTLLTEYNPVALIGMNEGYRLICERYIHPVVTEEITLDTNKQFDLEDLTNIPRKIISITLYQDYSEDANWRLSPTRYGWAMVDSDTIVVPDADALGTVYITYEILPADLTNTVGGATTSPLYIPTQYHRSLCYMANSKLYARDNQKNDAMFWEAQFYSSLETISNVSPQTEIENAYAYLM